MVRHASLFSQLVALFHRQRFYELVYRHRAERYARPLHNYFRCRPAFSFPWL